MSHLAAATRTVGRSLLGLAGLVGTLTASCRCAEDPLPTETLAAALSAAPSASASARVAYAGLPPDTQYAKPSGPMLAVLAGQGVGAIRFGATVATVERLMELPCQVKTETRCAYPERGVEFGLVGGAVDTISIHRAGRPAGKNAKGEELSYGFFRGAIPPDLRLGMVPTAIQEYLKQPERTEPISLPNPTNTVERHYYPGLIIEYDRHTNGKAIMGGIQVVKANVSPPK
jgi:hypothetical protein